MRYFLLLTFLLLQTNSVTFASTHSFTMQLMTNQIEIVEFKHFGKDLNVKTNVVDSKQIHFTPKAEQFNNFYFVLGPYDKDFQVNIETSDTDIGNTPNTHQFDVLEVKPETKTLFVKAMKLFNEMQIEFSNENLKQLLSIVDSTQTTRTLRNTLSQQLFYHLRGSPKSTKEIVNAYQGATVQSIVLYCDAASQAPSLTDNQALLTLGRLSESLVEVHRQKGLHKSAPLGALSPEIYEQVCSPVLDRIMHHLDAQRISALSEKWTPITDAEAILEFVRRNSVKSSALVKAEMHEHYWFLYNYKDNYSMAEKASRQAITLVTEFPQNEKQLAKLYSMLSSSLVRQGLYNEAQRILSLGLDMSDKISQAQLATLLFNKGFYYKELGEHILALRYFEKGLAQELRGNKRINLDNTGSCVSSTENLLDITYQLVQIGSVYRHMDDLPTAEKYLNCASKTAKKHNYYTYVTASIELAKIALKNKDYPLSMALAEPIMTNALARNPQKSDALLVLIESAILNKQHKKLFGWLQTLAGIFDYDTFYTESLTGNENNTHYVKQIEAFRLLVLMHSTVAKSELASMGVDVDIDWLSIFSDKAFSLINNKQAQISNPHAWNTTRYAFVKTFVQSLDLQSHDKTDVAEIFSLLERFYSTDLNAEQNLYRAEFDDSNSNQALSAVYNEWLAAERQYVFASEQDKVHLQASLAERKKRYAEFSVIPNRQIQDRLPTLNIAEIQTKLAEDEVLIRYFLSDDIKFYITVTKAGSKLTKINAAFNVDEQVELLRADIISTKNVIAASSELAQEILPLSLLSDSKLKNITLILDDTLHQVPFSMLNISKQNSRYIPLASQFSVTTTHSFSHYFAPQDTTVKASEPNQLQVSVFADPEFNASNISSIKSFSQSVLRSAFPYPQLPGSNLEAQFIEQTFSFAKLNIAKQKDATKSFLMGKETRQSDILHIATHGYYDKNNPEVIGLLTSNQSSSKDNFSGFLSLNELLSKPIDSQLVVISGCNTMLGKVYRVSGMQSMTRGFLSQGAKSVIGTLWPVQDRATAEFMKKFYHHLLQINNVALALQQTQKDFALSGRYRHPKYWAGFVLASSNNQHQLYSKVLH